MKLSRDAWLGIGILVMLTLVVSVAALQRTDENELSYLSTSSAPSGTLAMSLWLNEVGYQTADAFTLSFNPDSELDVIFIIQPMLSITLNEWKLLDQWVDEGGTLILAGTNRAANEAMTHFDFNFSFLPQQAEEISAALPLLKSPVLASKVHLVTDIGINSNRTDVTPLMSAQGMPIILLFQQGDGRVILSTAPEIFTNQELKNEATATLVLNLLAFAGGKGTVLFDEWHRGFQSAGVVGLSQWLQQTSGGHAILFTVFAVFIALIVQGRSFGRPVPLKHELKRRAPLEHVTAIANLNRKAGHRKEVARQYHHRLKRHFGQRYRLDPSMRDEEYVEALASYNSSVNKAELLRLLKRLSEPGISEAELLKLSAEAARWMNE
jgi:hypothetical protein